MKDFIPVSNEPSGHACEMLCISWIYWRMPQGTMSRIEEVLCFTAGVLAAAEMRNGLETKGGFYITQIKQRQERIFEKLLRENGIEISGGQGRILFVLWKNDNLTIGEISRKTSLAKNTVSIVVDGMVQKGIVERNINPDNRRQTIISLTEYARGLREKYEQVSQKMNHLFYQGFSEEERIDFERYLARILDTLTQLEDNDN